jgi:hypothetical protein
MKIVSSAKKRKSGLFGFPGSSCTPSSFFLVFSCNKVNFVQVFATKFCEVFITTEKETDRSRT